MDPRPLDLRDYLSILWARKWIVIAIVVITTSSALAYSLRQDSVYSSSAEIMVLPVSFDPKVPSTAATPPNMLTELQVANSDTVQREAFLRLAGQDIPRGTMLASQVEGAEALVFTSVSSDARGAQATAQAHADAYLDFRQIGLIDQLNGARESYQSQIDEIDSELEEIVRALQSAQGETLALLNSRYSLLLSERVSYVSKLNDLVSPEDVQVGRILRSANLPRSPSAPRPMRDGSLGFLVGLAIGIGVAFLRDRLDERVRGRQELEALVGAPVLAFIPWAWPLTKRVLVTSKQPGSVAAEAFRGLAVRLLHATAQRVQIVLITSAYPDEGKTSVVANLGLALALAGKRVVIVSADLRRPRLQDYFPGAEFGGSRGAGLAEVLTRKRNLVDSLSSGGTGNLRILHAGGESDSPMRSEHFGFPQMGDVLADLRDLTDLVLIDTSPLLTSSDVASIAPLTDGVLFVVDPYMAYRRVVEQACRELELIGVPLVGVVVNKHEPRRFRAYGFDYGYGYAHSDEDHRADNAPSTLRAIPAESGHGTSIPRRDTRDLFHP